MPFGVIAYYYFNGKDGCPRCKEMTGYYDDRPVGPHGRTCECPISKELWAGYYDIIYKNKREQHITTFEVLHEGVAEYVNQSNIKAKFQLPINATITGEIGVTEEIEKAFSVSSKYSESKTVSESVEVELEPDQGVRIDVIGIMLVVVFSAHRYFSFKTTTPSGDTEHKEVFDKLVADAIVAVKGHRIVLKDL